MSTAALHRHDAFAPPRRPEGMGRALGLAIVAHVLLVVALTFHLQWKTSEPEGIEAELWSAVPQQAAPRAVAPEPPPQPTPRVEPRPEPPPPPRVEPPAARVDPDIALEKARQQKTREDAERREAERARDREQRREQEREQEREKAQKAREARLERERTERVAADEKKKRDAERARQDEQRLAALRDAQLQRMMGQAAGSDSATATGTAARTSGPSAGYAGRIKARVRPNIVTTDTFTGNPTAEVEVRTAPDGTIVGRRITKPSGNPQWDETVLRAIDRTGTLPRDTDGRVPSPMILVFNPRD